MSETKKTAQAAAIYSLGIVIQRIAGLIMLPIYTRHLTPADYGSLELLTMTSDVVALIAGLGIAESIFRFYFKKDEPAYQNEVLSTALIVVFGLYFCVGVLGISLSHFLARIVLTGANADATAFAVLFGYFILDPLNIISFIFIRIQQKPVLFVTISLVKLVVQITLNIFFLVILKLGFLGVVFSSLISQLLICAWFSWYLYRHIHLSFSKDMARKMIQYGFPLALAGVGTFIATFSDRYFLKAYADLTSVGIYSLGYKFGFILSMLTVIPLFTVWEPKRFQLAMHGEFREINQRVFFFMNLAMITVALGIALFVRDLLRIMSAQEFWAAASLVPYILIAYVFQGWTNYVNFGLYYSGKTKYLSLCSAATVIVILILSLLLIPFFQGLGAAIATLVAFALNFAMVYGCAEKFYKLRLSWKRPIALSGVAIALYLVSRIFLIEDIGTSLFVDTSLFLVFILLSLFTPLSEMQDRKFYIEMLKQPKMVFSLLKS